LITIGTANACFETAIFFIPAEPFGFSECEIEGDYILIGIFGALSGGSGSYITVSVSEGERCSIFVTEITKVRNVSSGPSGYELQREGEKSGAVVDVWLGLGIFLLGAGSGALLTLISYISRIRKLKAEMEAAKENDRRAA